MADLTDKSTQQLFRTIVREETRTVIREETLAIIRKETPAIIRAETQDMRETLDLLVQVQGSQSMMLRSLSTDVTQIKETVRSQGVFYEDLEDRFTVLAENLSESLTMRQQVSDHETRLLHLEATSNLPKLAARAAKPKK